MPTGDCGGRPRAPRKNKPAVLARERFSTVFPKMAVDNTKKKPFPVFSWQGVRDPVHPDVMAAKKKAPNFVAGSGNQVVGGGDGGGPRGRGGLEARGSEGVGPFWVGSRFPHNFQKHCPRPQGPHPNWGDRRFSRCGFLFKAWGRSFFEAQVKNEGSMVALRFGVIFFPPGRGRAKKRKQSSIFRDTGQGPNCGQGFRSKQGRPTQASTGRPPAVARGKKGVYKKNTNVTKGAARALRGPLDAAFVGGLIRLIENSGAK